MSDSTPSNSELPDVPFRGIESFRYVDHPIFFARSEETGSLLRLITIYRGVLIYGDSGVGKSSLINAGFLPTALAHGFAPHRLRVHPRRGEEIIVERISERADGNAPYLPSIFVDDQSAASRVVLSLEEFKNRLAPFHIRKMEDRLALKLKEPADALSKYLRAQLNDETVLLLDECDDGLSVISDPLRKALARDLRRIIQEESLYEKKRFSGVPLSEEAQSLAGLDLKGGDRIYLNQLLLEEAYPREAPPIDKYPLLIFDQFEEFVTLFEVAPLRGELQEALAVQAALLDVLAELLKDESLSIKLIFSFREDYLAKLTKLFKRCPELTDQYLRLTPIQTNKLDDIICGPSQRFPEHFRPPFPPELVTVLKDAIIARSESGTINLTEVQVACLKLWQSSDPSSLFRQKQIDGLLVDYLNDSLNHFPKELRDPAIALLIRLVTSSSVSSIGTRNIVSEEDLITRVRDDEDLPEDLLKEALRRLEEDTKLVRRERRYNVYFYEIVSEFLVPWISEQREMRRAVAEQRRAAIQAEKLRIEEKEQQLSQRVTFDERAFIAEVEATGTEEFALTFIQPSAQQETALRKYFGDVRYQRLRSLALKRSARRSAISHPKGNVVVIHGIMGSHLGETGGSSNETVWINAPRLASGWFERLRLDESGRREFRVSSKILASGIMKRHYGELLLSLSVRWNVEVFWFDWRKDLNLAADELNMKLKTLFDEDMPFHLVAHSMGGLVARTFIKRYPKHWDSMRVGPQGGRLIMLGTPNHGSFMIPQILTGRHSLVRKLAMIDPTHRLLPLLETLNSFAGLYQMLPSPLVMREVDVLYNSHTYKDYNVPQHYLDNARQHHEYLRDVIDEERMIYIAGHGQPTFNGIAHQNDLSSLRSYKMSLDGDGLVPHELGLLSKNRRRTIPAYYLKAKHGELASHPKVLMALNELLETGSTGVLPSNREEIKQFARGTVAPPEELFQDAMNEDVARLALPLARMESKFNAHFISSEERKIEEAIGGGFLSSYSDDGLAEEELADIDEILESTSIEIGLVHGGIHNVPYDSIRSSRTREGGKATGNYPVDAVAVGHYVGVQPAAAELQLDRAISSALLGRKEIPADYKPDLLLTQYTERGIIHGKLGQPFFMPDPRQSGRKVGDTVGRLIAIAGMGEPGRFGVPELTILARELCWSLGRLKRRHLATVLIGTGAGNLSLAEAFPAWMAGIQSALSDSQADVNSRLHRITFVEHDPRRLMELNDIILRQIEHQKTLGLTINYKGLSKAEINFFKQNAVRAAEHEFKRKWEAVLHKVKDKRRQTRVTLGLDLVRKVYLFGAVSDVATVAEREIALDPAVVMQANDELAGEQNLKMQKERSDFLQTLLIPDSLRLQISDNEPLVLRLDPPTARIHWELLRQPQSGNRSAGKNRKVGHDYHEGFEPNDFLGTSRGVTRQLRTSFAAPHEPPPPPRRVLRVLVVADPAADARLPGAAEEGAEVADLFECYNIVASEDANRNRIEVKRLFGPFEATRTNVLRELMNRHYDVLHFAGHCVYRWGGDPTLSGWLFNAHNKEILSANEFTRIDRVPSLVFSSASEIADSINERKERAVDLAPTFAESFSARGVANFICCAWPVSDMAARQFALSLYSGLLGISIQDEGSGYVRREPVLLYEAMHAARVSLASSAAGATAWGAYQHYGNPFFQFFHQFSPAPILRPAAAPAKSRVSLKTAKKASRTVKRGLKSSVKKRP